MLGDRLLISKVGLAREARLQPQISSSQSTAYPILHYGYSVSAEQSAYRQASYLRHSREAEWSTIARAAASRAVSSGTCW